ncbi:MAG: response regulator transcription factor [Candidatus Competibacteraceae bacterium]|nr:MAG: response regulator transcription factor [Candidatus Competibacteraceae bacterium]
MTTVLLVDDDIELSGMLKEYLEREGFAATTVGDGESGVTEALSGRYAIVVLDVMMPYLNGIEALRRIRMHSRIPVLMLTAKGEDIDRIVGLELGADDYVPKPCTPRELVARLRAILRRGSAALAAPVLTEPLVVGPLTLWPAQRRAEWAGRALELTSTEFNLLQTLLRHAGRVVSKAELSEQGLGRPLARFDRSIDVHMSSIRQKLDMHSADRAWIQTVRGIGYQFVLDVRHE